MDARHRIFLAYAREDETHVRKLYTDLKARGFDPWLDKKDLRAGQIWKTEIPRAIRGAQVFLACLSNRSVNKVGYVQNELRLALAAFGERPAGSIFLIPVRLDDCEVPDLQIPDLGLSLRDIQWVDLWRESGFGQLIDELQHALGEPQFAANPPTLRPPEQDEAGTVFRDIDALWVPEMVVIPLGSFLMGSTAAEEGHLSDEGPQHEVHIAYRFAVGRYPVTFEEYDHFCEVVGRDEPDDNGWGRSRRPVINVSWNDAKAYCAWLSRETGQAYRLPSEAEWEYACRAGTTTRYWWGDEVAPGNANYGGNLVKVLVKLFATGKTTEVGSYPPNPWGVYDMHGNVWEWVEDCWNDCYEGAPNDGNAWTSSDCSRRVLRGGSLLSISWVLRAAFRESRLIDLRSNDWGFRVARTLR